jgi:hypothetical protein
VQSDLRPEPVATADPKPKPKPANRGTRLPNDWRLPKAWGMWALEHFHVTPEQVRNEAARFRDHWTGKAGASATRANWEATWRNWMRSPIQNLREREADNSACADDLISSIETNHVDVWDEVRKARAREAVHDD